MKVLYFDIVTVILLFIILITLIIRKMLNGRANRVFVILLVQVLLSAILDVWLEAYGIWLPATESNQPLRVFLYYAYFLIRNLTTPMYHLYVCAVTDTWHILKKSKWLQTMLIIPCMIICVTLFTNPIHHMTFYFDDNFVYHRGNLIYSLYLCSLFYFVCGVVYLIRYRIMVTKDKFAALLMMYPLNLLAILIQLFRPQLLVEIFMSAITMLLITLIIQRPEEIINPLLGVRNYIAYTTDMKKTFLIHKPVHIIFVKLTNYRTLFSVLDYDTRMLLLKEIALDMSCSYKFTDMPMDLYYLENGLFAFVTEKDTTDKLRNVAELVSKDTTVKKQIGKLKLELKSCVCMVKCPEDIDNYEMLLTFGNIFHTYLPGNGVVNDISEETDKRMLYLRTEIDRIISNALAERRFQMYYQPIYSIKEKRFLSAEALIRLNDENYGFISPELLITAAENSGMILEIGDFVLDEVCGFLARCGENGLPIDYIELNLSMKQCMQTDLKKKVLYYMNKYNLRPEQINLEITETAANEEQDIVEENILELSKEGISFSLDDYGTGYSNLSRIMELPFQIIKLDKSLADKDNNSKIKVMLKNTIQMLHEMGIEIVVEGVETEETLQYFTQIGCDFIQGFYFSKPLPEQEFVNFIRDSIH